MQNYTPSLVVQIETVQLVSPSLPQSEILIPTIVIGLGKPYTKMDIGAGLELDDAY
jgi:hypothetical protein